MRAIATTTEAAAALCADLARALGYPVQCTDLRGSPIDVWTTVYVEAIPHPTDLTRAAVPLDETIEGIADPTIAAAVAGGEELGAEWFPGPPAGGPPPPPPPFEGAP